MDWVRPDGGDWTRFKAHPLVNWAHAIPVGRGVVEHKSLDFQGRSTVVAAGATEFFHTAADLDGIDRTEFDNPNDRTPVGQYSVDECLRAAEDAEALVRGNIATGVSIEFTPAGPKGSKPGEGAYWDLPGKSPLCPRPPRHFEHWNGHAYAHARMPVNPGCRTVLDDQAEVIEKAIRVAQTGRLPGGKPVHHLVLKAFRDAETLLPQVRGEGKGSTVRGGWQGDVVEEMERELKGKDDKRGPAEEYCPKCDARLERDPDNNTCNSCGYIYPPNTKSFGDTDIFALDLTIPVMEVRAGEDRTSMFGLHASRARGSSSAALRASSNLPGVPLSGSRRQSLKDWSSSPTPGTLGHDIRKAHEHAHDGDYLSAARVHGRVATTLYSRAAAAKDPAHAEALGRAADAHATAEDANRQAHSVVNGQTRKPRGGPFADLPGGMRRLRPKPKPLDLQNPEYHEGPRSVGFDRTRGGKLTAVDSTSKAHEVIQAALNASQNAHHASLDRSLAETVGGHRELLDRAYRHSRGWNSEGAIDAHGRLAEFHEAEEKRLAQMGDTSGSYAHGEAASLNRRAVMAHSARLAGRRERADELTNALGHPAARTPSSGPGWERVPSPGRSRTTNYTREYAASGGSGPGLSATPYERTGPEPRGRNSIPAGRRYAMPKAFPEHDTPEDDVATQSDYAKIANTASRLAAKMSPARMSAIGTEVKSLSDHRAAANSHERYATLLREESPKASEAHARAAEMHRRAAGLELRATDADRTPAFASAGVDQPPAGVQALLNFAQLLVDGSTALGYDIQSSDDVDLRKYASSLQTKAQDMAGELKALAEKMASRLKAASNGKGDTGPHPLAEGAEQPDAEAKALDTREDGSLVIKSYDNWTPRRFPPSALKTLPGGSNAVPTPAAAPAPAPPADTPVVKSAEEKAKEALLKQRVEEELAKAAVLTKRFGEVVDALKGS